MTRPRAESVIAISSSSEAEEERPGAHRNRSRSPRRPTSTRVTGVVEVIDLESNSFGLPRRLIIDLLAVQSLQEELARRAAQAFHRQPFTIRMGWPPEPEFQAEVRANSRRATTKHILHSLPVERVTSSDAAKELGSCPICLVDYRIRMTVRVLPCGHKIHKTCFDSWAKRKLKCPLDNLPFGDE